MSKKTRPGRAERKAAAQDRSRKANASIAEAKTKLLPRPSRVCKVVSGTRQEEVPLEELGKYGFSWPVPSQPCKSDFPLRNWKREDHNASGRFVDDFSKDSPVPFEKMRPGEFFSILSFPRELGSVLYWQKVEDEKYVFITFTYRLCERNNKFYWSGEAVIADDRDFQS